MSCTTNVHQVKSPSSGSSANSSASTAGSASPSFSPDSRFSEWRMRRGTRGFVTTAEESTGSVGESSAPRRNDSVQSRSVSACVATATSAAVMRHREHELAQGQVPLLLEQLRLHLEPVAEQDQDQARRSRASATKPDSASNSSTLGAALAEGEARQHEERGQREEAALREPRQQRPDDEQAAEHSDGHLERVEVVHGGNLRARWTPGTSGPSTSSPTSRRCCARTAEARVVAINLPAGEALDDHQVHERAYLVVVDGEVRDRATRAARETGGAGIRGAVRPERAPRGARDERQPAAPVPRALAGRGSPEPALTQ